MNLEANKDALIYLGLSAEMMESMVAGHRMSNFGRTGSPGRTWTGV